jgi:hypothetical protein
MTRPIAARCLLLAALAAGCSTESSGGDICQQAIDVIEECTGSAPAYPEEGCVADFADTAEGIVAGGCDAVAAAAKSDILCTIGNLFGLCPRIDLAEAARVETLADVCPAQRADALCSSLRAGDYAAARDAARALATGDAPLDPAFRFYLRERVTALVIYNKLTANGSAQAPANYAAAAAAALDEHYPAYRGDTSMFAMARSPLAPLDGQACSGDHVIAYFPGVVRPAMFTDFQRQFAAIEAELPCATTVRIETGNFIHPSVNAQLARETLAPFVERGATFHLIGYSQGSSNALQTLVDVPEVAARTASMLGLNSAARGSEVGDAMFKALSGIAGNKTDCGVLDEAARATCQSLGGSLLALIDHLAAAMGLPLDTSKNLAGHLAGVRSLTTIEANEFWSTRAAQLPRGALYTSFRTVISDSKRNLPISNRLFFSMLERAGGNNPYNDMQVRLPNQSYGGPIADREVALAVAEGNHWQWELDTRDVDPKVMPADMSQRTPQTSMPTAYFQALFELGLIF